MLLEDDIWQICKKSYTPDIFKASTSYWMKQKNLIHLNESAENPYIKILTFSNPWM